VWIVRRATLFYQIFHAKNGLWQISYDGKLAFLQTIASFTEAVRTVEQPENRALPLYGA